MIRYLGKVVGRCNHPNPLLYRTPISTKVFITVSFSLATHIKDAGLPTNSVFDRCQNVVFIFLIAENNKEKQ